MAGLSPSGARFSRSLADFSALACDATAAAESAFSIAAAAAVLEAEFDAAVSALHERQSLLERLSRIQQSILRRADLQATLDAIVAGTAELLDEPLGGVRLVVPGIYQSSKQALDDVRELDAHAAIAAPVREQGRVVGSLAVTPASPDRRLSAYEQEALTAFAEHASLALTDARMVADALHQAVHDALTDLPNRTLFADRVQHALARARRRGGRVAVLFFDLDHFKVVNDSLGHHAGDELLLAVAERVRGALRESDTVARFGGDEFAVLLEDVGDGRGAIRVAEQLNELLQAPFALDGRQHVVSASVGIALSCPGADTPAALVRDADAAMYRAKLHGRAGYEVFDDTMRAGAMERMRIEDELRTAIGGGELVLNYQPIVAIDDGRTVAAEALVRWRHPTRGLLAPAEFIAVAEDSGLIVPMGEWVLVEACRACAAWNRDRPGEPISVSVNLSPRQVGPQLIETVAAAVADADLDPHRLVLEITERVLLEDSDRARSTLKALQALGVRLLLDDFGTGYSSLGYLRRLPLDGLKIDRSFVDGLGPDQEASAIVSAIAGMAASLGLSVVAEGVETDGQLAELRKLGCQRAQGFHFSRPLDGPVFAASIADEPHALAG